MCPICGESVLKNVCFSCTEFEGDVEKVTYFCYALVWGDTERPRTKVVKRLMIEPLLPTHCNSD